MLNDLKSHGVTDVYLVCVDGLGLYGIPKNERTADGIEDKILALYAAGMTTRDVAAQIKTLYDIEISNEFVSNVTNRIMPLVSEWHSKFLDANASISENEMPLTGRIAYVSPEYYKLLKQDANFIKASDMAQAMVIKGQVGEVDGVAIITCPSTRLAAGVSFIITNPMACTSPIKLADYKLHEDAPGVAGYLVEGLVYFDAFILNNKKNAIATQFGKLGALTVVMTASTTGWL